MNAPFTFSYWNKSTLSIFLIDCQQVYFCFMQKKNLPSSEPIFKVNLVPNFLLITEYMRQQIDSEDIEEAGSPNSTSDSSKVCSLV